MDIGTLMVLAGLLMGAIVGDAVLYGRTMRVSSSLPPAISSQGLTSEATERLFIAELSRLSDIAFIIPFPTISEANKDSLMSVVARPLHIDPVVEILQRRFGAETQTVKLVMVNGPEAQQITLHAIAVDSNERQHRFMRIGRSDAPTALIEAMAREIASEMLTYRVVVADYVAGLRGDPEGFSRASALADRKLTEGFDKADATRRVMLHNTLALIALQRNDAAEAHAHWEEAAQVPLANGTSYAIVATNRAVLALAEKDVRQARSLYEQALKTRDAPYLPYFDHHLEIIEALILWGERRIVEADARLAVVSNRVAADTALTYRARLLAQLGRGEEARGLLTKAQFMKTLKETHPDLLGSVFWVDPVNGGLTPR
jgi:hypothetical protein